MQAPSRQSYITRIVLALRHAFVRIPVKFQLVGRLRRLRVAASRSVYDGVNKSKFAVINSRWPANTLPTFFPGAAPLLRRVRLGDGSGNWRWGAPRVAKVFYVIADFDGVLTAAHHVRHG